MEKTDRVCGAPGLATTQGPQSFNYKYDRYGNRWQQNATGGSGNAPAPQYTFDSYNHIAGANGVSYDAAGNVIADGSHTYSYDAENRLVSLDGGAATYLYDAQSRRVQTTTSSGTQELLFDVGGHAIAAIRSTDGGWLRGEVWSPVGYLATYVNLTTYFNHSDWLGTVRARSAMNGSASENYITLPFGDASGSSGISPLHFTGQVHDDESQLDHFLFRQYSSAQGRWTSVDPAGLAASRFSQPQSLNRYSYVRNNVISSVDRMGLCDDIIGGITQYSGKPDSTEVQTRFANLIGANMAYPYGGQDSSWYADAAQVGLQGMGIADGATQAALLSLKDSISQTPADAKVNVFAFSGGAQAFNTAYGLLSPSDQARIGNVTYISPGTAGSYPWDVAVKARWINDSSGLPIDGFSTPGPDGPRSTQTDCSHSANCQFGEMGATLKTYSGKPCSERKTFTGGARDPILYSLFGSGGGSLGFAFGFADFIWGLPVGPPVEVVNHRILGR